jgi:hypothetical protein
VLRQTKVDVQTVTLSEAQKEFGIRSLIEQQVGRQFAQFEIELLKNFQRVTEHIAQENARALADQVESRLQILESISAGQSALLARLSVPGQLAGAPAESPSSRGAKSEDQRLSDSAGVASAMDDPGRTNAVEYSSLHCPRCTSRHIRRASRANFLEQSMRLFGVAPFRCRSCRHKFYRLQFQRPAD